MSINKPHFVYFCACACFLSACSKSTSPPNGTPVPITVFDSTFFPNGENFEVNGLPSLDGWVFHPSILGDTITFSSSTQGDYIPPGDTATWSITLRKSDVPPITNNVTKNFIQCSSGVYSLTVWLRMKKVLDSAEGYNPVGWVGVIKHSGGLLDTTSVSAGDSTGWSPVTVLDTLSLLPTDTVTLMIASGMCDSSCHGNPYWYDEITFKKLP
jgi:hypothetical protein